jgi:hypothetical protein
VRQALLAEGENAARFPLFGLRAEPPLCFAIKVRCYKPEIVALLLEHDADVEAADSRGRTSLSLLSSTKVPFDTTLASVEMFVKHESDTNNNIVSALAGFTRKVASLDQEISELRFANILISRKGADPLRADARGEFPVTLAAEAGRPRLACLLSWYGDVQASIAFSDMHGSNHCFRNLPRPVIRRICFFLVPEYILQRVHQLSGF